MLGHHRKRRGLAQHRRLVSLEMEPLYINDTEISNRLGIAKDVWSRVKKQFEVEGWPKPDPIVGKRYWPAVERWLSQRHGLIDNELILQDGKENWQ